MRKKIKKSISIILLILLLIFIPQYSSADLTVMENGYTYEVINPEGAVLYDENNIPLIVIPYKEKIEKIGWVYGDTNGYYELTYKGISGIARQEDFSVKIKSLGNGNLNEKNEKTESNSMTSTSIALMCIGVAILIAVYAIVTIQLINKRKNRNNESENKDGENKKSSNE